ncbi:hypothetical protein [Pontibacter russatus]|uniref:hypothetical protein n=1 Tax=Pontibacter russatus TaxID=2694929 RepID=UPI00137B739A|nr:hypothetical protein [Pontibacter russatus]
MEDFKLILYVLAAVAYFIFMQWRKAFNAPKEEDDDAPRGQGRGAQAPARPATSFEDILRELQPKLERAEAKGKAVVERTKELAGPVGTPFPPVAAATPAVKNYEAAPSVKALSWEKPSEARLAAKLLEEQRIRNHFNTYERRQTTQNKYATLLRNPASAREAFVLTEIFNRKYS